MRGMRLLPVPVHRLALRCAYKGIALWWRVRRPSIRGAFVAVWHGERVLLIRNSYQGARAMPGGGVARGEAVAAAAVRELREEIGLEVVPAELRYACTVIDESRGARDTASFYELHVSMPPALAIDGREVVGAAFEEPARAAAGPMVPPVRLYLRWRGALP